MLEHADLTAAITSIQETIRSAGLEREISLIASPGEITLRDTAADRPERGALQVTIATEQLLEIDATEFVQRFIDAYLEFKSWG